MTTLRRHWITFLALALTGFLIFIAIEAQTGSDTLFDTTNRNIAAIGAVAMLAGLLTLRSKAGPLWVGHSLIVVALVATGSFFWVIVATAVAAVVLYAGVIRQGLVRELRPA